VAVLDLVQETQVLLALLVGKLTQQLLLVLIALLEVGIHLVNCIARIHRSEVDRDLALF